MRTTTSTRFVYLILSNGIYKIGSSADPEARRPQVAPLGKLVHHFPSANAFQIETALHRRFASCVIPEYGREWFRLSQDDVDAISRLARTDTVADLPSHLQPPQLVSVRIDADLVRMVKLISVAGGYSVPCLLDQMLRPSIEQDYQALGNRICEQGKG